MPVNQNGRLASNNSQDSMCQRSLKCLLWKHERFTEQESLNTTINTTGNIALSKFLLFQEKFHSYEWILIVIVCFGMAGFSEEYYTLGNIDSVKLTVISWMSCPRTNPIRFYMYLFNNSTIQVSRAWNLIAFCCEKQKQNHNNKTFGAEKKEYVKRTWADERVTERESNY